MSDKLGYFIYRKKQLQQEQRTAEETEEEKVYFDYIRQEHPDVEYVLETEEWRYWLNAQSPQIKVWALGSSHDFNFVLKKFKSRKKTSPPYPFYKIDNITLFKHVIAKMEEKPNTISVKISDKNGCDAINGYVTMTIILASGFAIKNPQLYCYDKTTSCGDLSGNEISAPVINGKATFENILPIPQGTYITKFHYTPGFTFTLLKPSNVRDIAVMDRGDYMPSKDEYDVYDFIGKYVSGDKAESSPPEYVNYNFNSKGIKPIVEKFEYKNEQSHLFSSGLIGHNFSIMNGYVVLACNDINTTFIDSGIWLNASPSDADKQCNMQPSDEILWNTENLNPIVPSKNLTDVITYKPKIPMTRISDKLYNNLFGYDDIIWGSRQYDTLFGSGGYNILWGRNGNDTLKTAFKTFEKKKDDVVIENNVRSDDLYCYKSHVDGINFNDDEGSDTIENVNSLATDIPTTIQPLKILLFNETWDDQGKDELIYNLQFKDRFSCKRDEKRYRLKWGPNEIFSFKRSQPIRSFMGFDIYYAKNCDHNGFKSMKKIKLITCNDNANE